MPSALVIEDEPIAQERHGALLRAMGWTVHVAGDGLAAMQVLRSHPEITLALVDWYMEPLNGYAFAAAIRAERRYERLVLVMVTAEERPDKVAQALQVGVDAHLHKPLRKDRLATTLKQIPRLDPEPDRRNDPPYRSSGLKALTDGESDRTIGPYLIEGKLGRGASSSVYLSTHPETGQKVAIKLLHSPLGDEVARRRFAREAELMVHLQHPHVLNLIDAGTVSDLDYLVMEYAAGGDALDLIAEHGGRLPETLANRLITQCAEALATMHHAGIAHRDIKPSNVFLDDRGGAKLGDFGLALNKRYDDQITGDGLTVGTPAYMAPEQIRGVRELADRSDLYSLGATWYHLVCGRPPFEAETAYATFLAVERDPLIPPAQRGVQLSAITWQVMSRLMSKQHSDRPAHIDHLLRMLVDLPQR
jgi:serine/threonine protein kinase